MYRRKHGIYVFPSFLSSFHVYVSVMCMCVSMNVHVRRCVGACAYVYTGPRLVLEFFLDLSATFFFEAGSLIQIQSSGRIAHCCSLACSRDPSSFCWGWDDRWAAMPTGHLHELGYQNSCPTACIVSILTAEPSPQPYAPWSPVPRMCFIVQSWLPWSLLYTKRFKFLPSLHIKTL